MTHTDESSPLLLPDKRSWLDGFRRITSSGNFIPEIDGLRFIAISTVVIYHIQRWAIDTQDKPFNPRWEALARGVEVFFAISGFVLGIPFAAQYVGRGKRVRLRDYFLRRISRLEPPYLLSLCIMLMLKYLSQPSALPVMLKYFGLSAVYAYNATYGGINHLSIVIWSLEVEVQFYLLMPVIAMIYLVRPRWLRRGILIAIAFALAPFQYIVHPTAGIPNHLHLLNFFQFFAAGLLLADIWVTEWRNAPPPIKTGIVAWGDFAWLLIWPALILVSFDIPDFFISPPLYRHLLAPLIFLLFWTMFHSVWPRKLMRVKWITIIGGMCYSIYLIHNGVIQSFGTILSPHIPRSAWATPLCYVIMTPLVLLFCGIFFKFIERPCMYRDWPKRLRQWLVSHLFIEEEDDPASNAGS